MINHANEEYLAEGVKYRLVITHNPFTMRHRAPFDIENDIYGEWVRLFNEQIHPTAMICGHTHTLEVIRPGDEKDVRGQQSPVVIGSCPDKNGVDYAGAGLVIDESGVCVTFTDSLGQVVGIESV